MDKRNFSKPIRMWIDGRCYNIRKLDEKRHGPIDSGLKKSDGQIDQHLTTKIILPPIYYTQLARFRRSQVDAIQNETNTIITHPTYGKKRCLEISGSSEESIEEAKEQMLSLVASIRKQIPALQFISIPIRSDEITKNFNLFKEKVLAENYEGVEESIFQSALKLHLTVVVFALMNDQEKQQALEVLEECKHIIQKKNTPLKVRINGLHCMNPNYSRVNVLFAGATFTEDSASEKSLQEVVDSISDLYYERGLCKENKDNVKLHMTIMNTKYRNRQEGTPKKRWVKKEPFDATKIMDQFRDYHFGDAVFDSLHLSLMSTKGEDGFYKSLGSIHI